ncbi:synaptonemal complex protein 1-like [Prunus avium]|uniref:Synaptonemal complex protein 1-like n=1 Tax=Prunus avium TaxID=42229 RepID=A0A6P5T324_PRUAV|nr:synaptonemal complex protein 1-like [Prunus avium]
MVVKSMLRLFCFLHYVRMIQKPLSRVVDYSQFFDYFIDLILIGLCIFLDFVMHKVCQDIRKLRRQTRLVAKLRKRFLESDNGLLGEKENQLQFLRRKLNNVEYELMTKTKELVVAEADSSSLSNLFNELHIEQGIVVQENRSLQNELKSSKIKLQQLQYELEEMTQEVLAGNNYASALQKRSEEAFLNHSHLFADKEKQLQLLRTRLDQLGFELENKEKEVNVAEGNNDVLRNLYGGLLEENQSLKSQLQSYDNKFKQLESEIEKKTEFDHVCELQFWKATLSQVEYELRTKTEELDVAEANITSLSNLLKELHTEKDIVVQENQQLQYELYERTQEFLAESNYVSALQKRSEEASLNHHGILAEKEKQLQSLRIRLDQLEFELENKEKEVCVAEADTDIVRKLFGELLIEQGVVVEENQSLKSQLQSYDNKLKQLEHEVETETEANIIYLKEDLEDDILEYDQLLEETKILRSQLEREIVTDSQESQED